MKAEEVLAPNDAIGAQAREYKAAKTQRWVDAEVRWREWQQTQAGGQGLRQGQQQGLQQGAV